jgi:hypothetical protein
MNAQPALPEVVTLAETLDAGKRIGVDWPSARFDVADLRAGIMHEQGESVDARARAAWTKLKANAAAYEPKVTVEVVTPAEKPNPAPPTSRVHAAVQANIDERLGLAFVPTVVQQLLDGGWTLDDARAGLLAASKAGEVELRPESGMGRLTRAQVLLCPAGFDGTPLSWVRLLDDAPAGCASGACAVPAAPTVRSLLETVPGLKSDEQYYVAHLMEYHIQADQSFDRAVMLRSLANAIDAEDDAPIPKGGMSAAMKRAVLTLDMLERGHVIVPFGATGLWKAQCPCKAKRNPTERIPGTRAIGTRFAQGESEFIESLMERGELSEVDAEKVYEHYRKHKLIKRQAASGRITVKHGAFMERDVIRKALALENAVSASSAKRNPNAERFHYTYLQTTGNFFEGTHTRTTSQKYCETADNMAAYAMSRSNEWYAPPDEGALIGITVSGWDEILHEEYEPYSDELIRKLHAKAGHPEKHNIAAYRERASADPLTGEDGVLRVEWRVRPVGDFTSEALAAAWGPDWRRFSPSAEFVLEQRYVRRGVEEPWAPFQTAGSREAALGYIDDRATAVDPELIALQAKRRDYQEQQRAKVEAQQRKATEQAELRLHRDRAQAAFVKLAKSKDGALAERWNSFMSTRQGEQTAFANDAKFMALYKAASEAETVPAKRAGIKEFLFYVDNDEAYRAPPPAGQMYTASVTSRRGKLAADYKYVSELPGTNGPDWGYTDSAKQALPLTEAQARELESYYDDMGKARELSITPRLPQRNPSRVHETAKASRRGTVVQTLLFDKATWTPATAKAWAKAHGFKHAKVDTGQTVLRVRQLPPDAIETYAGTIPFGTGTGIQAVVGWPR